ncbi:hypothetical protein HL033_01615 [Neoehrlichia mikurensis]|uniref:Uncharacterized protein n=1 Tax=Neoehrlichia mikurensis TaxID=89586 RepID=A0A9Q9BZ17_9RICK|nr:hypothetical protein [Neoehrlichia mikurensis]QXK92240.1 hypothetical protein IAH97_01610 [Neoehrlichia mikurensis]QXK92695.1 hypothetical protein HUN61_01605 [Neoehrlichia mikurensis]QXK93933.1 hypothetical protein HL033_01615 [Neoehrlichia mikurensis]UTO55906.1 hypothetical protein LUA82_02500 [Neoehrlichia mikurensis]UTO56822.1 hypothetical protein LUA81_02480 [Neoehrlichia mikurensis]
MDNLQTGTLLHDHSPQNYSEEIVQIHTHIHIKNIDVNNMNIDNSNFTVQNKDFSTTIKDCNYKIHNPHITSIFNNAEAPTKVDINFYNHTLTFNDANIIAIIDMDNKSFDMDIISNTDNVQYDNERTDPINIHDNDSYISMTPETLRELYPEYFI